MKTFQVELTEQESQTIINALDFVAKSKIGGLAFAQVALPIAGKLMEAANTDAEKVEKVSNGSD